MRWDKIVSQIHLILSFVNVALAAPAVVRHGHLDVAGAASEKRWSSSSDDGSKSTSSVSSTSLAGHAGDPEGSDHSGSIGSAPSTPDVLAQWQEMLLAEGLLPAAPGSESESESEPGSSRHSTQPQSPTPPHPDELAAANPEANKLFNDALKQKIKDFVVLGTVVGVSAGLLYGVQKEIMGSISPGAETVGRDLENSGVVGHSAGTLLHGLPDHPRPRKSPVSQDLANLRDEDLRLLSVLTHRALESLV